MPGFEIFGDEERKEVNDVLSTGVLFRYGFDAKRNGNWKVKTFEENFANYTGAKYCLLTSSGTTALATAMAAAGIGFGDEVIVPPFTFVATIEGVLNGGAVPIFSEIDETLCLSADLIEEKITDRTRAIVVVHMCGSMADIERIKEIADKYNLILLEDACQATGAFHNGKSVGTYGVAGCFSFDSVKTITCGEGGAIITNSKEIYQRADQYHDHGHDHIGNDRGKENHPIIGINFRNTELNAAVGVAQLKKLPKILEIQRKNGNIIKEFLSKYKDITLRKIISDDSDTCTFVNFLLPTEEITRKVALELNQNGADGCFYWYDNNWHYIRKWEHILNMKYPMKIGQTMLDYFPDYSKVKLPLSDSIMSRTISMQVKLSWTEEELNNRLMAMERVFKLNNIN